MRNYKDLLVWEKAHKLTLAVYKITRLFPKDERYGLTSQVRRGVGVDRSELGGGLRQTIRWRDGTLCPDRYGIGR